VTRLGACPDCRIRAVTTRSFRYLRRRAGVAEWQTQRIQNPVAATMEAASGGGF
jgi:hypothetical protein